MRLFDMAILLHEQVHIQLWHLVFYLMWDILRILLWPNLLLIYSGTKEQIAGMKKIRTDLEGKLRTAESEEVKQSLQEKIDNLNEDISNKIQESQEIIRESVQATGKIENSDEDPREEESEKTYEEEEQSENGK